jgi:hypothetical protein
VVRAGVAERKRERGIEVIVLSPGQNLAALVGEVVRARMRSASPVAMGPLQWSRRLLRRTSSPSCASRRHTQPLCPRPGSGQGRPGRRSALTDGVERRIDLAQVNGRLSSTMSHWGSTAMPRRPSYRGAKVRTLLETARAVLGPSRAPPELHLVDDAGTEHTHPALVLISNNLTLDRPVVTGTAQPSTAAGSGSSSLTHRAPPAWARTSMGATSVEVGASSRSMRELTARQSISRRRSSS